MHMSSHVQTRQARQLMRFFQHLLLTSSQLPKLRHSFSLVLNLLQMFVAHKPKQALKGKCRLRQLFAIPLLVFVTHASNQRQDYRPYKNGQDKIHGTKDSSKK